MGRFIEAKSGSTHRHQAGRVWHTKRTRRAVGVAYIHTGGAVSIVSKAGGRGKLYPRANDSPEVWGDRHTIEKRVLLSAIKAERIRKS